MNFGGGSFNFIVNPPFSEFYYGLYTGLRQEWKGSVYGALGFLGSFEQYFGTTPVTLVNRSPYRIGPYVELEYQSKQYFQGFIRVMPYTHIKNIFNNLISNYFHKSQIGIK